VPSASAEAAPPTAGARFAEAMGAFSAGQHARADALFAAFVRDFPRDGRAEDATFLRIEVRARRGDAAGARAAARDYLRAYPRGLRRPEAERIAGGADR
jgi:TolA-binding protein